MNGQETFLSLNQHQTLHLLGQRLCSTPGGMDLPPHTKLPKQTAPARKTTGGGHAGCMQGWGDNTYRSAQDSREAGQTL